MSKIVTKVKIKKPLRNKKCARISLGKVGKGPFTEVIVRSDELWKSKSGWYAQEFSVFVTPKSGYTNEVLAINYVESIGVSEPFVLSAPAVEDNFIPNPAGRVQRVQKRNKSTRPSRAKESD